MLEGLDLGSCVGNGFGAAWAARDGSRATVWHPHQGIGTYSAFDNDTTHVQRPEFQTGEAFAPSSSVRAGNELHLKRRQTMKFATIVTAACAALACRVVGIVLAPDVARANASAKFDQTMSSAGDEVSGIKIPDSKLARDAAQFIRDSEGDFLFQHSTRVYYWAALAGKRKGLTFDPELLYVAAMFHDFGLTAGLWAEPLAL